MANQAIALQARAPRIPTYNELIAGRDQARSRQNTMAMQEQGMQQAANAQAEAAQQKAAMRQALMMAGSGDIAGAEKQYGLGAGNLEVQTALSGLKKDQTAQVRAKLEAAGVAAFAALTEATDDAQRKSIFQQAAPMLQAAGWTPEQITQMPTDDKSLKGAIVNGLKPDEAFKMYAESQKPFTIRPGEERRVGDRVVASLPALEGVTYKETPEGLIALPTKLPSGGGGGGLVGGSRGNAGGGAVADALQTNPGALKDGPFARSQPGYAGASGGFATFKTPQAGIAAQESLLRGSYINKGFNTVSKIIDKYAPQGRENSAASVANYKKYVAQQAGIDINAPISPTQIPAVAKAMREFETGQTQGRGGIKMGQVIPGTAKPAPAAKPAAAAKGEPTPQETLARQKAIQSLYDNIVRAHEKGHLVAEDQSYIANMYQRVAEGRDYLPGGVAKKTSIGDIENAANQLLRTFIKEGTSGTLNQVTEQNRFLKTVGGIDSTYESRIKAVRDFAAQNGLTLNESSSAKSRRSAAAPASSSIPQGAIDKLKQNPSLRGAFEAKYGAGSAARVLGRQ